MHPILFHIGRFSLHTYGLVMAVAFAAGIWVASRRAVRRGLSRTFALDISIVILVFSLVGARATYVATHWEEFAEYPLDIISPVQHTGQIGISGLVLLGGVAAGFLATYLYARRKGHAFLAVSDLLAPPTALGIAIGRLGCFFNGCCFGVPADVPWCVHFPAGSYPDTVFPGQCVHPTQLYEALFMLLVFALLMLYDRVPRPRGRITGLFLLLYGVGRYLNEQLRWYEKEMILFQSPDLRFTFSQLLSVLMVLCGIVLVWRSLKPETGVKRQ